MEEERFDYEGLLSRNLPEVSEEHGGDEPAQQDSRGRPEQDGDRGHASRMRPSGTHTGGMQQGTPVPAPAKERKPS